MATPRISGPRNIRRHAFEKLATLSLQNGDNHNRKDDIDRLCRLYGQETFPLPTHQNGDGDTATSTPPMGVRELELVVALSKSAHLTGNTSHAERILHQIAPYLVNCNRQTFLHSTCLRTFQPSPWQVLVYDVTMGILAIGNRHASLRQSVRTYITKLLDDFDRVSHTIAQLQLGSHQDKTLVEQSALVVRFSITYHAFVSALADDPPAFDLVTKTYFITRLASIVTAQVGVKLDAALTYLTHAKIQNAHRALFPWKRLLAIYSARRLPLGLVLLQRALMRCLAHVVASAIVPRRDLAQRSALDILMDQPSLMEGSVTVDADSLTALTALTTQFMSSEAFELNRMAVSDDDAVRLSLKANALLGFSCCSVLSQDIADPDLVMSWFEAVLADDIQLSNSHLAQTTLKCTAVLASTRLAFASMLARVLPHLIVQGKTDPTTAVVAADCLARALLTLPEDMRISTLYSLGNVLSIGGDTTRTQLVPESVTSPKHSVDGQPTSHVGSMALGESDEAAAIPGRVIQAIVRIAVRCDDEKISALALSMLLQKLGSSNLNQPVTLSIIESTAELGRTSSPNDFRTLLKNYARLNNHALAMGDTSLCQTILNARVELARDIAKTGPLYEIYLVHLLDMMVSTTGTIQSETRSVQNGFLGSEGISQIIRPLAVLISRNPDTEPTFENPSLLLNLSRDAWFNLVAHDYLLHSAMAVQHAGELQTMAMFSPSLIDNDRVSGRESGIDLNTVLRRNNNPAHASQQKQTLNRAFPAYESDIKALDYAELTFLNATHLIAILRARTGDCTRTIDHFMDPKFKSGPLSNVLLAIALSAVDTYLVLTMQGPSQTFSAPNLASQLVTLLQGCCHRVAKVQQVSTQAVDRIMEVVPSALCYEKSLFAMLELLTLMWSSCLEADTDEYDWRSTYTSETGKVTIQLSDDFEFRRRTLATFHQQCKIWVKRIMNLAPLNLNGLLQTYLSRHGDDSIYGHIALGRSFALEMGREIPATDHRLTSIDTHDGLSLDAASDFLAQYTTRQDYQSAHSGYQFALMSALPNVGPEFWAGERHKFASQVQDIQTRMHAGEVLSDRTWKLPLRGVAAQLWKAQTDSDGLIKFLVSIPFTLLTKDAIKLGIALWTGILITNARIEADMLSLIASQWISCVRMKRGIFSSHLHHPDPFYLKEEFAPSDRQALVKRQQHAHDLIAPHLRLVKFFLSHCNATRLSSRSVFRIFFRLARVTLNAIRKAAAQPLVRELHFNIVLLSLQILSQSTKETDTARWLLKDQTLSVGLLWFKQAPRWSFGGNKLQGKAEVKLMQDVMDMLQYPLIAEVGQRSTPSRLSLRPKQDLLLLLLKSEIYRLNVWLNPLANHPFDLPRQHLHPSEDAMSLLLETAWAENASLAIQTALRFPGTRLGTEIRQLLLRNPAKALDDPDGLQILLSTVQTLTDEQLKYLLYWLPVNPMTAVTLVMPEYGNHPFITQYAMRALESHHVDVTFFYVPQIVQTLRYDSLGYLERYIIETARFSQLFAHQIIWNMKANAYKDDESTIPDSIKPVLDQVMSALIGSFSLEDKDFYEREFKFFSEVTNISGKLKPFIKRPKPEKKQKIEEELRKIQVDVGVYLPSNPDGVLIGIDRQSGKPLQSHAKAPFMATFRIRKERQADTSDTDEPQDMLVNGQTAKDTNTYEVWQSAIFKVGDDCRQDVLALQLIAAFRGIFNNVGLNVYVFPYRVTATAPGCGVIDVLPNSISRDMLGREQVNGLYEYFVSKYGNEDSPRFQAARHNFVRSMAAYSVISYLLQFKDRHNGNIMIDDAGHILHIDFGFCFDIAPGGVKFERAPFKLTSEMVAVMGGSPNSQAYAWFEELCVKAFLACRPYADKLAHMVTVMLASGLPCFKPETMKNFRDRFVLEKPEREAAEYMRMLIRKSESSFSTVGYDQFQYLTNSIPYQVGRTA